MRIRLAAGLAATLSGAAVAGGCAPAQAPAATQPRPVTTQAATARADTSRRPRPVARHDQAIVAHQQATIDAQWHRLGVSQGMPGVGHAPADRVEVQMRLAGVARVADGTHHLARGHALPCDHAHAVWFEMG